MKFLTIFLLFLFAVPWAQTKEQILEGIRSGQIPVTPKLIEQGQRMAEKQQGKVRAGGESAKEDSTSKEAILPDSLDGEGSVDSLDSEEKAPEVDEYEHLISAGLDDLELKRFGLDFFDVTQEDGKLPVPPYDQYIIGFGDEIVVYTWGRETGTKTVYVDKDGFFNYPPLAPIRVSGLSFARAQKAIKTAIEEISGLQARISLGQLKSISVMILGDVKKPGSYVVPSGTSVINALFAAGGVSEIGTMRRILLKRRGRTRSQIDLYNLFTAGNDKGNRQLVSGDVIFVPVMKNRVAVAGYVKRPAIYEAKAGERISNIIRFAGGLAPDADAQRIVIERVNKNREKIVFNLKFDHKKAKFVKNLTVQDGDLIKVFPLRTLEKNSVYLVGNVIAPGKYQFRKGMTLKSILPSISSFKPKLFLNMP